MRDRIITVVALLFIAACVVITVIKIESHYSPAGYQAPVLPDSWTPSPLVPDTASPAPASTAPAAARPRRTVIVKVTVTPAPATATGGEDGQ